jgi:hypothetical protein
MPKTLSAQAVTGTNEAWGLDTINQLVGERAV